MDLSRFDPGTQTQVVRDYLRAKYAKTKVHVIIAVLGPSLDFLVKHGNEIFPEVPVVFCGVDPRIARTLVEAHGGRLWAENRAGGGAILRLTVPMARVHAGKKTLAREGDRPAFMRNASCVSLVWCARPRADAVKKGATNGDY